MDADPVLANEIVFVSVFLFMSAAPPFSYVSALFAKTTCHDDGVFDPVLNVLPQAVPPTSRQGMNLSLSPSLSSSVVFREAPY